MTARSWVVEPGRRAAAAGLVDIRTSDGEVGLRARTTPTGSEVDGPWVTVKGEQVDVLRGGVGHWHEVEGRWRGDDVLEADAVRTSSPGHVDFFTPAPTRQIMHDGNWPRTALAPGMAEDDRVAELMRDGTVVSRAVLTTPEGGQVMAVAATRPEEIAAELRAVYGDHAWVFASGWTRQEYDDAHAHLNEHLDAWQIHVLGDALDARRAQVRIVVAAQLVTPEIAQWHRAQPEGLVDLRPWVRPV